jgi:hypothetical protein
MVSTAVIATTHAFHWTEQATKNGCQSTPTDSEDYLQKSWEFDTSPYMMTILKPWPTLILKFPEMFQNKFQNVFLMGSTAVTATTNNAFHWTEQINPKMMSINYHRQLRDFTEISKVRYWPLHDGHRQVPNVVKCIHSGSSENLKTLTNPNSDIFRETWIAATNICLPLNK